jgi:tetratricopeptide (TPR) repeat protein
MFYQGTCPRCGEEIPKERYATGFAVCSCGWADPTPFNKHRMQRENKIVVTMVVAAVCLTLAYGHLARWGSYAFEIPFVRIAEFTGTLSKEGYQELAQACVERNKWSCAKDAYIGLYRKYRSTGDSSGLASLAALQLQLGETQAALASYGSYVNSGGKDATALLKYAQVLEGQSQFEDALRIYDLSIAAAPQTLPVRATTGIVRILMQQEKLESARARIVAFHESAENAKGYLTFELAEIEGKLNSSSTEANKKLAFKH